MVAVGGSLGREYFCIPVWYNHLSSWVELVSRYWVLTVKSGERQEGQDDERVQRREKSWVYHEDLWSPQAMEKEKEDGSLQRSATGLEMRLRNRNWKDRKANEDWLIDFLAGVASGFLGREWLWC